MTWHLETKEKVGKGFKVFGASPETRILPEGNGEDACPGAWIVFVEDWK